MKQDTYTQQFLVPIHVPSPQRTPTFNLAKETRRAYWEPIIRESATRWGAPPDLMVKIADCESGFDMKWNYLHDTNPEYYTAYGLFQVVAGHEKTYGISRMTPDGNMEIAMKLYLKNGTQPWVASRGCWSR